jgi:DNA-binding MarR family transcriptional regulator
VSVGYILLNIDLEKGTPATKIAPLLGLEARSITRTLKNMEEVGFIYKVQDEKDRRFFRIFLTEKGKNAREHARETVLKFNEAVLATIPTPKLDTFFEVIGQVNQIIDQLIPKNLPVPETVEELP